MMTYEVLSRKAAAFQSLMGMSVAAFETLYQEFEVAHEQRLAQLNTTKRRPSPRQRARGAGRRHRHSLRERLLLALFWLRVYPTYEVLGFFFSLDKTNAEDNCKDVLATLESMTGFVMERPGAERSKLRTPQAVMEAFPDVRLVIDAREQRVQRPSGYEQQKPFYSGKKKTHTLKHEIAVAPDGQIEAVSQSVPGGATHDLTLQRQTQLVGQLAVGEAAMLDKGYDGLRKDYPDRPLYLPFKARRNHPLSEEEKAYNRLLASYRIIVEHTIAQLTKFGVLSQVFRHARKQQTACHTQVVRIVAGLINRRIQQRPLKTYAVV
jgi:hypothetical protein